MVIAPVATTSPRPVQPRQVSHLVNPKLTTPQASYAQILEIALVVADQQAHQTLPAA